MNIFVDTSAFLAILDAQDPNHERADQIWKILLGQGDPLVSTNYVVVETISLVQRRFGLLAAQEFQDVIVPLLEIEWVDQTTYSIAMQLLFLANQRRLNLVDCVSFAVMNRLKISTAFVFDKHFNQQGFTCLR